MSRITPVASPSPPLRSASRHQTSPQLKSNFSDLSIHRKSTEPICESPTDFQLLTTKSTDAYQDEEHFPANCKKNIHSFFSLAIGKMLIEHGKIRKRRFCPANKKNATPFCFVCFARILFQSFLLRLFRSN